MNTSKHLLQAHQEVWYVKFNDPLSQRALWLRFCLLTSRNGFKRIAETWAIYFQKNQNRDVKKVAIKQTYDLGAFSKIGDSGIQIAECELSENQTRGKIQSKGNIIQWDLSFSPFRTASFDFIPKSLAKIGLIKNSITTQCEDLMFSGTAQVNGETITWKDAPGMKGHWTGTRTGHSWIWGQCNAFQDEQKKPTDFVFEGITTRTLAGPVALPRLSSFFFLYKGKEYSFNTLKDAFYIKSKNTLTDWSFQADRDDLSFRGFIKAEHKDFAGLTYEDTNGSLLYCASSKLSNARILVYRGGKLESTFISDGTAAFEVVSREKNPYVPLLI